ncbi:MAG: hypothetical protein LZF86_190057 [Nitrospira sp.]|nr:MAG: hypothetical protein LZF86_190057 [Nitrospira sp.]
MMRIPGLPPKQGLYDTEQEKDSCAVGFVLNLNAQQSHSVRRPGSTNSSCQMYHGEKKR